MRPIDSDHLPNLIVKKNQIKLNFYSKTTYKYSTQSIGKKLLLLYFYLTWAAWDRTQNYSVKSRVLPLKRRNKNAQRPDNFIVWDSNPELFG
jgi:hypothetical protein